MTNWMRSTQKKITDFNKGSVARTMVEAPAQEIDELYQQVFIGLREAIPVAVYHSFDFEAKAAVSASGLIQVTIAAQTSPVVVQQNAVLTPTNGGKTYRATENTTIAAGETTASISVVADSSGVGGNLSAGESFTINPSPTGFVSAINPNAFTNGREKETDDERKTRFKSYIEALARGTTSAISYGAKNNAYIKDSGNNIIERVSSVQVDEPWKTDSGQPVSLVNVYVHNGTGATSTALVAQAQKIIDGYYEDDGTAVTGWKAAGVRVVVMAATETAVNYTAAITLNSGYSSASVIAEAQSRLSKYLQNLDISKEAVHAEMVSLVKSIEGVYDVHITTPSDNVAAGTGVKLMPGTAAITAS